MTTTQKELNNEGVFNMSWLFFFIFTIASLNSVVVYSLLKKAGFQMEEMLVTSLLCLLSACVAYDMAVQDVAKLIPIGEHNDKTLGL